MTEAFNFEKEVQRMMENPPIDEKSSVIIWGGVFDAKIFKDFMAAWSFDGLSYVIQEHAHKIDFQLADANSIVNQNPALLERMEIFGASGNLSLRRNGDIFLWCFIGNDTPAQQDTLSKLEAAKFGVRKFWEENPQCRLYRCDESALLWGEYEAGSNRWHDDRVGWATLDYPVDEALKQGKKRVQISYTVFTDNGQTAFVWRKNLKEAKR